MSVQTSVKELQSKLAELRDRKAAVEAEIENAQNAGLFQEVDAAVSAYAAKLEAAQQQALADKEARLERLKTERMSALKARDAAHARWEAAIENEKDAERALSVARTATSDAHHIYSDAFTRAETAQRAVSALAQELERAKAARAEQ